MAKLHELLAVKKDKKNKLNKKITNTDEAFNKYQDRFSGFIRKYEAFNDENKYEEETLSERKELVYTVPEVLKDFLNDMQEMIDIEYQNDIANQTAVGTILLDKYNIKFENIPATTLLSLEDYLRSIYQVIQKVPVLDLGVEWEKAEGMGENIYKTTHKDVKARTKKMTVYKEVAKATERHPAQIVPETQDVAVGKYIETKFSGRISSSDKTKMLHKIEDLMSAVKEARSRANEQELVNKKLEHLLDFILE